MWNASRRTMRSTAPVLALLAGAACMVAASFAAAAVEDTSSAAGTSAVLSLLETARHELNAGRPQQASTLLERALRIQPSNAAVWHYLGRARLDLGNYEQAAAMATKAHSLGGTDRALRVSNAELMTSALQSSGRTASSSERQVLAAPNVLDSAIERARRYADARDAEVEHGGVESRHRFPRGWRDASTPAWQRAEAAARRAQAAAQRAEAAARRAAAERYRRYYRRYEPNEGTFGKRQY